MNGNLKNLVAFTGCVALFTLGCVALPGLAFADNNDLLTAAPVTKLVERKGNDANHHQVSKLANHASKSSTPTSKLSSQAQAHPHPGNHHPPPPPPPPPHVSSHTPPPPPSSEPSDDYEPPPPPPEDEDVTYSEEEDNRVYHVKKKTSSREKAIGLLTGGGITLFMGGGLGIRALMMDGRNDSDHKARLAVGITGACVFGLGAILVGFGGYYLYEWKKGDYAFSVTPTYNGAVLNMRF